MRTAKDSHDSTGHQQHTRAIHDPDQKTDWHGTEEPSPVPPPTDALRNEEEPKPPAERDGSWWQRFRTEFLGAHPENQVAQVYHLTAIVAVAGSLVGGVWAFGEYIWSEKPAPAPQHSPM